MSRCNGVIQSITAALWLVSSRLEIQMGHFHVEIKKLSTLIHNYYFFIIGVSDTENPAP